MDTSRLQDSSYAFLERILLSKSLFKSEEDLDDSECLDFWCSEDVVEWFKAHGYTPYSRNAEQWGEPSLYASPSLPFDHFKEGDYPYAYHCARPFEGEGEPTLSVRDYTGRMIFAQDQSLRHVAIKALHIESDEYRVVHFLSQLSLEDMRANCILPVLHLFYFRKACFMVMPRWGSTVCYPDQHSLRDLLHIMRSALKDQALVFLHSNSIIHRDIHFGNFVVNHFGNPDTDYLETRTQQMAEGSLIYAIIDFDVAIMLPNAADTKKCRLPYRNALFGSCGPHDVSQGEYDYNPFAYDVGCLGFIFCARYQHHTKDLPLLAPLLDMMTTRDITRRFTAEEALQFVERVLTEAEPAQLCVAETPKQYLGGRTYETYDRWEALPIEFQQKWAAYRAPVGVPITSRILRTIVDSRIVPRSTVPWVRWILSRLLALPYLVGSRLSGFLRSCGLHVGSHK